ncbi:hypothetical protein GCM10007981_03990 [Thermocladium modestius]|uniref:Uncharacterized protein n=2 Tax=Thermocladium modestius TaxID=62609 RepID=A0A830GU80_9CREN|nr:hypothetical protein GCM10007981_03990 [Thermocladium modestius]
MGGLHFGLGHGLGFLIIALPLVLAMRSLPYKAAVDDAALAVSLAIACVAVYSAARGIDLELGPRGAQGLGVLQGALALTPTKVLVIALAAAADVYVGIAALAAFTLGSVAVMTAYGRARAAIPSGLDRVITIAVSLASILYAALGLLGLAYLG